MKRIIISLFLVLSLVMCLTGCPDNSQENPVFDQLEELLLKEHSNYVITIDVVSPNGNRLNETYTVTYADGNRSVDYRIEKFNSFTIEGNEISVPDEYITVEEGTYSEVQSASKKYAIPEFNFSNDSLKSVALVGNTFTAIITSFDKFMGIETDATDATVSVNYSEDGIDSISIAYKTSTDSKVILTYTFN